ncbi:hypothetical protein H8K52_04560 [Undibacterium seohonense]|uniref:Transmembrane protein n=1 Tax=Undibacterium seohonense TaxID=1344950 RepID=A0ABR6X137_9BURK|nr:hypothetical protein [Undibacterium seohonense]MBC3806617.1 hypothetical protein [Undibacterium seohonense]
MKPKNELPWRRRELPQPKIGRGPAFLSSRVLWAGAFAAMGALGSFVLLQGVDSLKNMRTLPSEVRTTYNTFLGWYFDDAKWTGTWSSREEGNIEDFRQSDLPLELTMSSERGKVSGEMFNLGVCSLNPLLAPVLIEGEINGKVLIAYAYAYVGGEKRLLYTFDMRQESVDPVATIKPIKNPLQLLPTEARLVRRLEEQTAASDVTSAPNATHPDFQCAESPLQYIQ